MAATRPPLPEQHLLDACAAAAAAAGGPVAVAGGPSFVGECLRRLRGVDVTVVGPWAATVPGCAPAGHGGEGTRDGGAARGLARLVLWSPPERGEVWVPLAGAAGLVAPRGTLYAAFRGALAPFRAPRSDGTAGRGTTGCTSERAPGLRGAMPVRRRGVLQDAPTPHGHRAPAVAGTRGAYAPTPPPSRALSGVLHPVSGLHALRRDVVGCGLAIDHVYGFQGVRSLLWAMAARVADRAGREDLGDQCRFAMRAAMVTRGADAWLCPVGLVVARRRGAADS